MVNLPALQLGPFCVAARLPSADGPAVKIDMDTETTNLAADLIPANFCRLALHAMSRPTPRSSSSS